MPVDMIFGDGGADAALGVGSLIGADLSRAVALNRQLVIPPPHVFQSTLAPGRVCAFPRFLQDVAAYADAVRLRRWLTAALASFKVCRLAGAHSKRFESRHERQKKGVDSMDDNNDALWPAFEALARRYPDDGGVRMAADLARWLLEEHQRACLPAPPIVHKIIRALTPESEAARAPERSG